MSCTFGCIPDAECARTSQGTRHPPSLHRLRIARTTEAGEIETIDCHQIVTKSGAKRTKTEQIQKTEILAILRLAKGFT
jgi:hypothetical protein